MLFVTMQFESAQCEMEWDGDIDDSHGVMLTAMLWYALRCGTARCCTTQHDLPSYIRCYLGSSDNIMLLILSINI